MNGGCKTNTKTSAGAHGSQAKTPLWIYIVRYIVSLALSPFPQQTPSLTPPPKPRPPADEVIARAMATELPTAASPMALSVTTARAVARARAVMGAAIKIAGTGRAATGRAATVAAAAAAAAATAATAAAEAAAEYAPYPVIDSPFSRLMSPPTSDSTGDSGFAGAGLRLLVWFRRITPMLRRTSPGAGPPNDRL